jgi:hypothetical protein
VNLLATAPSRVVTQSFFVGALQLAIAKAQRQRQCVSVIGLSPDTLAASRGAPADGLTRFAMIVGRHIRATDIVLVRPPDALFLMLVDADPTVWPGIFARLVGAGDGSVLGVGRATPRWSVGGSCYPSSGSDPESLLSQASSLMTMARQDGGNRFYTPD